MKYPTCEYATENCELFECIHYGGMDVTMTMAEKIGLAPGMKVLDVACGRGTTACTFHKQYRCSITGIDINPKRIEEAKNKARSLGIDPDNNPSLSFFKGDERILQFSGNTFDCVMNEGALTLSCDPEKSLKEMLRVAKPGAAIAFHDITIAEGTDQKTHDKLAEFMGVYKYRTEAQWIELAEKVGMEVTYTKDWKGLEHLYKMRVNWNKKYLLTLPERLKVFTRQIAPEFGIRGALVLAMRERVIEKAYKNKTIAHFLVVGKNRKK